MSDSEAECWVKKAQEGDREAFAVLVDHYWGRTFRWLLGMTRDLHVTEDLAQEAFLKCWASLRSYRVGTNFRAWLFRIASNCLLDGKRRAGRAAHQSMDETLQCIQPGPLAVAVTNETTLELDKAISQLPDEFRGALFLRIQEELSYREIARILQVTEETARWRVFKARQMLVEKLGNRLD